MTRLFYFFFFCLSSVCYLYPSQSSLETTNNKYQPYKQYSITLIRNKNDNKKKKQKINSTIPEHCEWELAMKYNFVVSIDSVQCLNNFFGYVIDTFEKEDYEKYDARYWVQKIVPIKNNEENVRYFIKGLKNFFVVDQKKVSDKEQKRIQTATLCALLEEQILDLSNIPFPDGKIPDIVQWFVKNKPYVLDVLVQKIKTQNQEKKHKKSDGAISTLILSNCNLTQLPESFWDLFTDVVYLDLSHNQLSEIPDFTDDFKREKSIKEGFVVSPLKELHISYNCFNQFPLPFLENKYLFPYLEKLNISNNEINFLQIPCFCACGDQCLFSLDIRNNPLAAYNFNNDNVLLQYTFPHFFKEDYGSNPIRMKLYVNNNDFLRFILKTVLLQNGVIQELALLDISELSIGDKALCVLSKGEPFIKDLRLGKLTEGAWKIWKDQFGTMKHIGFSAMNLPYNSNPVQLYGFKKAYFCNTDIATNLNKIQFFKVYTHQDNFFIRMIHKISKLKKLVFRDCKVTNNFLEKLLEAIGPNVETLKITGNKELTSIRAEIPESLTYLDVSRNALREFVPGNKSNKLRFLNLAYNQLSNFVTITQALNCFKKLRYIDVSNNNFPAVQISEKKYTYIIDESLVSLHDGTVLSVEKNPFEKCNRIIDMRNQKEV